MPMSEQRARELAAIEPPRSMERIVRFVEEISRRAAEPAAPQHLDTSPAGFTAHLAARSGGLSAMLLDLLHRHQMNVAELLEFARWLARWNHKRLEIEVLRAPRLVLYHLPIPADAEEASPYRPGRRGRPARAAASAALVSPIAHAAGAHAADPVPASRSAYRPPAAVPRASSHTITPGAHPGPAGHDGTARDGAARRSHGAAPRRGPAEESDDTPDGIAAPVKSRRLAHMNQGLWTANLGAGGFAAGILAARTLPVAVSHLSASASGAAPALFTRAIPPPVATAAPWVPVPGAPALSPALAARVPMAMAMASAPAPAAPALRPAMAGAPPVAASPLDATPPLPMDSPAPPPADDGFSPRMGSPRMGPRETAVREDAAPETAAGIPAVAGSRAGFPISLAALVAAFMAMRAAASRGALPAGAGWPNPLRIPGQDGQPGSPAGWPNGRDLPGLPEAGAASPAAVWTARGTAASHPPAGAEGTKAAAARTTGLNPLMGMVTLVAPPLRVASHDAEQSGAAVAFDWKTLASGAGALDFSSLDALRRSLPEGVQAIYPALPQGSLGQGAVNLRMAPALLGHLLQRGYGAAAAGHASTLSGMAAGLAGGTPAARPLAASVVPGARPSGGSGGVLGAKGDATAGGAGALAEAGGGQSRRGQALDFLGLPVRLAPSLGGRPELKDEVALRSGAEAGAPRTIRPQTFSALRDRLFPTFQSVTAEPDQAAWRKAAPSFGLRDARPTTLLAPDARTEVPTATSPLPQSGAPTSQRLFGLPAGLPPISPAVGIVPPVMDAAGGFAPPTPMLSRAPFAPPTGGLLAVPEALGAERTAPPIAGGWNRHEAPMPSSPVAAPAAPMAQISAPAPARPEAAYPHDLQDPGPEHAPAWSPVAGSFSSPSAPSDAPPASRWTPTRRGAAAHTGLAPVMPSLVRRLLPASGGTSAGAAAPAVPSLASASPTLARVAGVPAFARALSFAPSAAPAHSSSSVSLPAPGAAPDLPLPSPGGGAGGPRFSRSVVSSAPPMLYAPAATAAATPAPLAVQRSTPGSAPSAPARKAPREAAASGRASASSAGSSNDIHLLANEVWSLLKRRLSVEADRRGRW